MSSPDPSEHAARLGRVRAAMSDRSLSALVVTDPANLFYLTGYNAWSFYTPQCLVVPAEGTPTLFARAMDAAGAGYTCDLPADRVEGYPEHLVHHPDAHPFEWITARACEHGLLPTARGESVAVEADSHFFSPRAYQALERGLDGTHLVDSRELVNWVRLVKSEQEVARMRIAGRIAQQAMVVALEAIRVGRRQCDVVAEIMAAQARGTPEHGGDYPAIVPMLPSGEAAGTPHLTWTDARFSAGEAVVVELAGAHDRYHAPLARTVVLGEAPRRLVRTADVVGDGMARVLQALAPGATAAEVHRAFNEVINSHGLTKDSRVGYSIGIGYPPDWGERTVSLRAEENTVLRAGMAFHVILGMWMDGWGYELSQPVVVTETGNEPLTDLPHELTTRRH